MIPRDRRHAVFISYYFAVKIKVTGYFFTDDDEYMAFGLSGSNSAVSMDNADVVVAHWTGNQPRADDYNLNQRSQVGEWITSLKLRVTHT